MTSGLSKPSSGERAELLRQPAADEDIEAPFLELALSAGQMGAWDWRIPEGRVIWSRELELIHGLEPGAFAGTFEAFQSDMHPADRERVVGVIERTVRERRRSYEIEYRIVRPDGEERWLEARGRLFVDGGGSPIRMLGICRDVTDKKLAEHRQAFLVDAARVLATSLDPDEVVKRLADLAVPRFSDWCAVHMLADSGAIVPVAVAHQDKAKLELAWDLQARWPPPPDAPAGVALCLRTGQSQLMPRVERAALEAVVQDPEQLRVFLELGLHSKMIVPLVARGRTIGTITLISAESRREFSEVDLQTAEEFANRAALAVDNARLFGEAQRALRGREDLLAMVSHDLRGPLAVASLAASQLLCEGETDGEANLPARHVDAILRSAKRMERLIRDMLDFSAIDAGTLRVSAEPQDLAAIAAQAVEAAQPLAREHSIDLVLEVEDELAAVRCDRERVLQIFDNLVGNAIKYTDEGGRIRITLRAETGAAVVSVRDTGVGIAPDHLPYIFDRYWHLSRRGKRSSNRSHGLGLFITKALVEAHDGEIWAESSPGDGSTFSFSLPWAAPGEGGPRP